MLRQALRISEESKTALLVGTAGSGKTMLAQTIHGAGPRAGRPMVTVSCTDFPESDLEEMLSPDNADGVFAQAAGGLLYLQDISALSPVAQARLYSVLFAQQQASDPLHRLNLMSGQDGVPDVQVIASSPRPLDAAVAEGMLRSDLFYLLSSMTLIVPPLSERLEDIPVLARHFLSRIRPEIGLTLAPDALAALQDANWPGNVRQLKNVLEQAAENRNSDRLELPSDEIVALQWQRCLSTRFPTERLVTGTLPPDSAQHANGRSGRVVRGQPPR